MFGYKTELVRVSAINRNERFVLSIASRVDGKSIAVILGTGCDWADAFERAMTSDTGRAAIDKWTEFLNIGKKKHDDDSGTAEDAAPGRQDHPTGGNDHEGAGA